MTRLYQQPAHKKKVKIEVIEVRGKGCDYGLEVGDICRVDDNFCNICMYAATSIFPLVQALKFGGEFVNEEDPYSVTACCPDPVNTVVFRISVIEGDQEPLPLIKMEKAD